MSKTSEQLKGEGNDAYKEGKFDEAVALYSSAIEIDPTNHVYFSNRSQAFLKLKKFRQALDDATKCIELESTFAKGYLRKASAQKELEMWGEALKTCKTGIKIGSKAKKKSQKSTLSELKRLRQEIVPKTTEAAKQATREKKNMQNAMMSQGTGLDNEAMQRAAHKFETAQTSMNHAKATINLNKQETQRLKLTLAELENLPDNTNVYKSVGKIYMKKARKEIISDIHQEMEETQAVIENNEKKFNYCKNAMQNAENDLTEIMKAAKKR